MDVKQPSAAIRSLDKFDSQTAGKHDPGQIVVLFDHRHIKSAEDNMSTFTSYYLSGLSRMGWASYWNPPDLDPGKIRLAWYTVCPTLLRPFAALGAICLGGDEGQT